MKTNKIKLSVTIFTMLLCFSLFAQRGQGGNRGRQGGGQQQQRGEKPDAAKILEMLDTNNDDKIDKDEAAKDRRGKIAEDFDEIDTNNDEFIDLEELKASLDHRKPKRISAKAILKEVDDNGDGTLNALEVAAKDKRELIDNFSVIDTNEDAELDLEELKVFYAKNAKPKRKRRN